MADFLVALGLVFVLEGIMFAAMPSLAKRAMANAVETPDATLRVIGILSAIVGVAAVWLVRG
jgi:uncharacterized protein YjeT (DUF2065 family)